MDNLLASESSALGAVISLDCQLLDFSQLPLSLEGFLNQAIMRIERFAFMVGARLVGPKSPELDATGAPLPAAHGRSLRATDPQRDIAANRLAHAAGLDLDTARSALNNAPG